MKNILTGLTVFLFCFVLGYFIYPSEKTAEIKTLNGFNVRLNPYGNNELAALVHFETLAPAKIQVTVKGREGAQDLSYTGSEETTQHSIEVLGLYPNYKNTVVLTAIYPNKTEKSTTIISVPKVQKRNLFVVTQKNDTQTRYHWLSDGMVFDENGWMRFSFQVKGGGKISGGRVKNHYPKGLRNN